VPLRREYSQSVGRVGIPGGVCTRMYSRLENRGRDTSRNKAWEEFTQIYNQQE
jgi:hypothetical protein